MLLTPEQVDQLPSEELRPLLRRCWGYGNGLGQSATYYCWEGGKVIADFRAGMSSNLVWEKSYVYLGGRLLATADISGTKYHHPGRLGTRLVTDATSGTVTTEQVNLPYGTALTSESSGAPITAASPATTGRRRRGWITR